MTSVLDDVSFCHLVVGVTDMDRAPAFYRDVIGMEVVFENLISGESFDAALHANRKQQGRVVGGLLGGARSTYEMHRGVQLQLGPVR